MISRRQLIGSGAAASMLALHGAVAPATERRGGSSGRVALVVVDERFDAAHTLAGSLAAPSVPRVALTRDALDLWRGVLAPLCAAGRHAIAGVTTERGFFLLRTLAADHRLRVRSRSAHGALVSWVIGPK